MSSRILVIGANGMLGGSVFRYFSKNPQFTVLGTVRSDESAGKLLELGFDNVIKNVDVLDVDQVARVFESFKPDYVVNCVGIIKQLSDSKNHIACIELNALLPHRLANLCSNCGARLVHFSTDCVFSGNLGGYSEEDVPDATDLYGRSKLLGEVDYFPHITLRTSIIGHALFEPVSLVDWYLSQTQTVNGYTKAIFSGLPTIYVAEILEEFIFNSDISGLYHLSVDSIDKYSLLSMIRGIYGIGVDINKHDDFVIDRSLKSNRFIGKTGFKPLDWPTLINKMHGEYREFFRK